MKKCVVLVLIFCGLLKIEALPQIHHLLSDDQQEEQKIDLNPPNRSTLERKESPSSKHYQYASKEVTIGQTHNPNTKYYHHYTSNESLNEEVVSSNTKRFQYASNEGKDETSIDENKQIYNVELQLHRLPHNYKEEYTKNEESEDYVAPIHLDKITNTKDKAYEEDFEEDNKEKEKDKERPCTPCVKKITKAEYHKNHKCNYHKKKEELQMKLEKKQQKLKKGEDISVLEVPGNKAIKMKIRITRAHSTQRPVLESMGNSVFEAYAPSHSYAADGIVQNQRDILDIHTFSKRFAVSKIEQLENPEHKINDQKEIYTAPLGLMLNKFSKRDTNKNLIQKEISASLNPLLIKIDKTKTIHEFKRNVEVHNETKRKSSIKSTSSMQEQIQKEKTKQEHNETLKIETENKISDKKIPASEQMSKNNSINTTVKSVEKLSSSNNLSATIKRDVPDDKTLKNKKLETQLNQTEKKIDILSAQKRDVQAIKERLDSHQLILKDETKDKKDDPLSDPMAKESSNVHSHGASHSKNHNMAHKDQNSQVASETKTNNSASSEKTNSSSLQHIQLKKSHNCIQNQTKVSRQVDEIVNHTKIFHIPGNYTPKQYLQSLRTIFKLRQKSIMEKLNKTDSSPSANIENSRKRGKRIKEIKIINEDGDEIIIKPPQSKEEIDEKTKHIDEVPKRIFEIKNRLDLDRDGNFNISYFPNSHKLNLSNISSITDSIPLNITEKTHHLDKMKESIRLHPDRVDTTTSFTTNILKHSTKDFAKDIDPEFNFQERVDTSESKSVEEKEVKVFDIYESSSVTPSSATESTIEPLTEPITEEKRLKHKHYHSKKISTNSNEKMITEIPTLKQSLKNKTNICNTDIHGNITDMVILNKVKYVDDKGNVLAKLQYTNNEDTINNLKEILVIECNKTIKTNSKAGEVVNMTKKEYVVDSKDYFDVDNITEKAMVDMISNETISTENSMEEKILISDKTSKLDNTHEEEGKIKLVPRKPCNHTGVYKREDLDTTIIDTGANSLHNTSNCLQDLGEKHKCKHNKTEVEATKTTNKELIDAKVQNFLEQASKKKYTTNQNVTTTNTTKDTTSKPVKHKCHHNMTHLKNITTMENDTVDYYEDLLDDIRKLADKSWEYFNDKELNENVKKVRRSNEVDTTTTTKQTTITAEIPITVALTTKKLVPISNIKLDLSKLKENNTEVIEKEFKEDKINNSKKINKRSDTTLASENHNLEMSKIKAAIKEVFASLPKAKLNNATIKFKRSLEKELPKYVSTTIPDTSPNPKVTKILVKRSREDNTENKNDPEKILMVLNESQTNKLGPIKIPSDPEQKATKIVVKRNSDDADKIKKIKRSREEILHTENITYDQKNQTVMDKKNSAETYLLSLNQSPSIKNYFQTTTPPKKLDNVYTFQETKNKKIEIDSNKKHVKRNVEGIIEDVFRFKKRDVPAEVKKIGVFLPADHATLKSDFAVEYMEIPEDLEITRTPFFPKHKRNVEEHNIKNIEQKLLSPSDKLDRFLLEPKIYHAISKRKALLIKDGTNPNTNINELLKQSLPKTQFMMMLTTHAPTPFSLTTKVRKSHFPLKNEIKRNNLFMSNKKKYLR